MNKIFLLFVSCVFIILCSMSSCTPAKGPVKKSPTIETGIEKPMFLGDRHQASGIECGSCHKEDPPSNSVSTDVCISCHNEYSPSDKPASSDYMDPHNSHVTFSDCSECHNAHKTSKEFCSTCHGDMGFDIP
jgi:hypothetical protein